MKKQLIITSATLMLGAFACKKNVTSPPLQNQGLEVTPSSNEVTQKMYDLPTEQTTKLIKTFKNQFTNSTNLKSTQSSNSLALDSSIWLLEAALNYDFDSPKNTEIGYKDSLKFTAPISNSSVSGTDFNSVYSTLVNLLEQKINTTTKIQVIDVSAKINEETIIYSCDITLFHTTNGQKTATPCDPFTTETASPSLYPTTIPSYSNFFLSCSGNPTLDGPSVVEIKLNSCSLPACNNGYYYTNIVPMQFNGQTFPSKLYSRSITSYADYCSSANKIITSTQLNQYKSGCNYLASFYKPTSPAGLSIINSYDLSLEITGFICCYWPHSAYWVLNVQYGTLHCNNGGGS